MVICDDIKLTNRNPWFRSFLVSSNSLSRKGPSWSWSYGNWIYNFICNQCLSALALWILIPLRRGVLDATLCDKICQWFAADSVVFFSGYSGFPHQ